MLLIGALRAFKKMNKIKTLCALAFAGAYSITATAAAAIPAEIQAGYDDYALVKGLIFPALVTVTVSFIALRWLRRLGGAR